MHVLKRCQKGKEDLSQASFKYTHFAIAGKSSYEDKRRSLRHHHMMISDAEGLSLCLKPKVWPNLVSKETLTSFTCPVYITAIGYHSGKTYLYFPSVYSMGCCAFIVGSLGIAMLVLKLFIFLKQ